MAGLSAQTSTQPTCISRALSRAARISAGVGRWSVWTLIRAE